MNDTRFEPLSQQKYKESIQKIVKDHLTDSSLISKKQEPLVSSSIAEQIESRRRELENTAFEQDILLKKGTFFYLILFLVSETVLIFIIAFFQGLAPWHFHLEEWTFKLLATATITQITAMFFMVVKHLFPTKN
jgi:ABC-type multidrug transport system permease subunit